MILISINHDGSVLSHGADLPFTHVSRKRASWIEPVNPWLRMAFSLLRIAPDASWVAGWTRTWHCRWRVSMRPSGGPVFGSYLNRADALEAESKWILDNHLKKGN